MVGLLIALLGYGLVVGIDLFRLRGRVRTAGFSDGDRRTLWVHLLSALVMPFLLVGLFGAFTELDLRYAFVVSLVGVWIALFSAVRLLLGLIERG